MRLRPQGSSESRNNTFHFTMVDFFTMKIDCYCMYVQYNIYSQSVALATERVHQKRFYTEQGEIPLLFLRPRGCVYFIFPHIITVVRQSSRGRTFSAVTKKWPLAHHPKIAPDLEIVVPRACAKIKKNRGHSFRARRDDAFCD